MKQVTRKVRLDDGTIKRCKKDMKRLLNLNYLDFTNQTFVTGEFDLPVLYCSTDIVPDYLGSSRFPWDQHKVMRH